MVASMTAKEIAARVSGVSLYGIQWEPVTADITIARRAIIYLEDRRVLYFPNEAEMPDQCVESVLMMRAFLTELLLIDGIGERLSGHLGAMRAACRNFLTEVGPHAMHMDWTNIVFNQALGQLRGTFGEHLAQIAVLYDLDVPAPLDRIIPGADVPDRPDDWFANPRG